MASRVLPSPLCKSCLKSQFSTFLRRQRDLPSSPPQAGYAKLTNRALISISGQDSTSFLQGLITQNVASPRNYPLPRTGFYAAFLNAQGRVLNDVFVYACRVE